MSFLEARNLSKQYRGVRAVDGVSFAIEQGSCFGLLGPNGAGKTTTVEMLEGVSAPSGGEILYRGQPLGRQFRDEAGIMFQSTALQDYITVREALEMFGNFYPRTMPIEKLVERCSLQEFLDRDTRKLSGGQRQRLLLAVALVNDPDVVFLDEPTTGLDPQARHNFWALVHRIKAAGKTVVLTTHYMEEAYTLCDKIIIMDRGRIIAEGTPKELLAEHFNDVVLQLPQEDFTPNGSGLGLTALEVGDMVEILTRDVNAAIQQLLDGGVSLSRLQVRQRTLEDLFLELTGRDLRP